METLLTPRRFHIAGFGGRTHFFETNRVKRMEAPEKIHLTPLECMAAGYQPQKDNTIEYTRTDTFIEKAVTYLEATLFNEVCYGEIRPDIVQAYINDFKKAMRQ